MKKVAHFVKKEGTWPNPAVLGWKAFEKDPTDSPLKKWARLVNSVTVVAAGEVVPAGVVTNGVGYLDGYGDMWANAREMEDVIGICEDRDRKLSDGEMRALTQLLYESLYELTSRGSQCARRDSNAREEGGREERRAVVARGGRAAA